MKPQTRNQIGTRRGFVLLVVFIARFFAPTKEVKPLVTIWSFLYDQDVPEPFTTMGLLAKGSSGSKAWDAWLRE
jgi:hypothetical protein